MELVLSGFEGGLSITQGIFGVILCTRHEHVYSHICICMYSMYYVTCLVICKYFSHSVSILSF
jgi:hypothetical protein